MRPLIYIALTLLLAGVGFVGGLVVGNIPFITFKSEVGFGDIANFILAMVAAIFIPVSLTKWMDNMRHVKDFLIDEVKTCLENLKSIKTKIDDCQVAQDTLVKDRRQILSRIRTLDMSISSLVAQLKSAYPYRSKKLIAELTLADLEYWREVTGGDLMKTNYKIDTTFCKNHDKAYAKLEQHLKKGVHVINHL